MGPGVIPCGCSKSILLLAAFEREEEEEEEFAAFATAKAHAGTTEEEEEEELLLVRLVVGVANAGVALVYSAADDPAWAKGPFLCR